MAYFDNRILHVSKAYASYEQIDPSVLLQRAHDDLYKRFKSVASGFAKSGSGSPREAKILQDFFEGILGLDSDEASENACKIEHVISDTAFAAVKEFIKKQIFRKY